jgi:hypothetical protein
MSHAAETNKRFDGMTNALQNPNDLLRSYDRERI